LISFAFGKMKGADAVFLCTYSFSELNNAGTLYNSIKKLVQYQVIIIII
jgi:hypothetical protein